MSSWPKERAFEPMRQHAGCSPSRAGSHLSRKSMSMLLAHSTLRSQPQKDALNEQPENHTRAHEPLLLYILLSFMGAGRRCLHEIAR